MHRWHHCYECLFFVSSFSAFFISPSSPFSLLSALLRPHLRSNSLTEGHAYAGKSLAFFIGRTIWNLFHHRPRKGLTAAWKVQATVSQENLAYCGRPMTYNVAKKMPPVGFINCLTPTFPIWKLQNHFDSCLPSPSLPNHGVCSFLISSFANYYHSRPNDRQPTTWPRSLFPEFSMKVLASLLLFLFLLFFFSAFTAWKKPDLFFKVLHKCLFLCKHPRSHTELISDQIYIHKLSRIRGTREKKIL